MESVRERNTIRCDRYSFESAKLTKNHKFIFLTDLHEKEFGKDNEELIKRIDEEKPDFIVIGGDSIVSHKKRLKRATLKQDSTAVTIKLVSALKDKYPVFYALGNHEERLLEKTGLRPSSDVKALYTDDEKESSKEKAVELKSLLDEIHFLSDTTIVYDELQLTGITLPMKYYHGLLLKEKPEIEEKDLADGFASYSDKMYDICMLHSPLYFKEAAERGADLVLSGHYHGGTIRIPHLGGLMTPQYQFLLPECSGVFTKGDSSMLVSRGLGTHSVNIRLNNYPELSVITLKPNTKY